jgi:hypothetical protein
VCGRRSIFADVLCPYFFFNFCPSVDRNKGRRGKKYLYFFCSMVVVVVVVGGSSLVSAVLGKPEAAATLCSSATNILGKIATNQSMTEFNCSAFFISFGGWILQSVSRTDSCFEYELLCICKVVVCHPSSQ